MNDGGFLGCVPDRVKGGIQLKQTLAGQGPKFSLPQLLQGGVGGGVQGEVQVGAGI